MQKRTVTTAIFLDYRRPLKRDRFTIKLRVTFGRKQVYYLVGKTATEADFLKAMGDRPRGTAKDLRLYLESFEASAKVIIEQLKPFSFEAFEAALSGQGNQKSFSVIEQMEAYAAKLESENRVSSAHSYRCALNAFRAFSGKADLTFQQITPDWLSKFETWMLSGKPARKNGTPTAKSGSSTTAGIYIRNLRVIYNLAIQEKIVSQDSYPFGRNRYQIPQSRNVKKAVSKADIQKLFEYDTAPGSESYHRDLWLFSYLCNGANMKDIAKLRYENLENDAIVFVRSKTARSSKQDLKPIAAHLTDRAKVIIKRWGQKPASPKKFIFPVLEDGLSPKEERARVQQLIKQVNKYIRRIAGACGINQPISTYTARHSFATVLKQSNAPISYISEALGHKDLKTTEHYLGSFDEDTRKQFAAALTDF